MVKGRECERGNLRKDERESGRARPAGFFPTRRCRKISFNENEKRESLRVGEFEKV